MRQLTAQEREALMADMRSFDEPEVIDIYHGSPKVIEQPVFGEGKVHNDYGRGFYCTELQENNGTYTVGPEYWAGWALAYYQWLTRRSFAFMRRKGLGIKEVIAMYYPLHEADLSKFAAAADNIVERN